MPHHNVEDGGGFLALFLATMEIECYRDATSDDLHMTGNLYQHEHIYRNNPDEDSDETRAVIQRANNIVRANTNYTDFSANHVVIFTMTGLLPVPCADMTDDDGVSRTYNNFQLPL